MYVYIYIYTCYWGGVGGNLIGGICMQQSLAIASSRPRYPGSAGDGMGPQLCISLHDTNGHDKTNKETTSTPNPYPLHIP